MRRDSVTLAVANVSWLADGGDPRRPALVVTVDDLEAPLQDRLSGHGESLDAGDLDLTFRFRGSPEDGDGVLSITNRETGEFLLEVNAEAPLFEDFLAAARRFAERTGDSTRYTARVVEAGVDEALLEVEKRTLLVYSSDGELLRQDSLIPSGVEI